MSDTTAQEFHAQVWAALGPVDSELFEAVAAQPPSDAEVAATEAVLDVPLPPEFVAFSRRSNGLLVAARTEVWPQPQLHSVGPAWTFWRGVMFLGIDTEDLPEWASLSAVATHLAEMGVTGIAPIFKVLGDGERVWGVDGDGRSVVVIDAEIEYLDASIADLYVEQIAELMTRQQKMAEK